MQQLKPAYLPACWKITIQFRLKADQISIASYNAAKVIGECVKLSMQ